ncbi:MAG: hypothetical protein H6981_10840 [Gammaproteobacteria bacterium]|nr:hypothetical protein [Gammaproteobacteria bacterium]MCP5137285.1 hypothetical protein [Gammaproteobacteria bacterium]
MKTFLRYALFGVLAVGVFFLVGWWLRDTQPEQVTDMPWQVDVDAEGRNTVFAITLGKTTLAEARKLWVREAQLALFSADGAAVEEARLEAFFDLIPLGTMISRVVLTVDLNGIDIDGLKAHVGGREPSSTGEWRYGVHPDDLPTLDAQPVIGVTYVPIYVRLDDAMLVSRFGQPLEVVEEDEGRKRWRYPAIGLEVLLDARGKAVFQYQLPPRSSVTADLTS